MTRGADITHQPNAPRRRPASAEEDVICGDCLDVLRAVDTETFDLAYLDPPFNTGRSFTAGADANGYRDAWPSVEAYLDFLRPRLEATARVLRPHGILLLHCDWRACHHLRLALDALFGAGGFVNHLIWSYGLGGSSPRRFARKHDDILFYAKSRAYHFEPPMVPATSRRMAGRMKKATDVIEIPSINNMAAERVDYPTQKPVALLTMLVEACCPPGGCVVDPFCGSGTTLVAARRTGRAAVGIDANERAVTIARQRLAKERDEAAQPDQ